ncbi:MAG TPA: CAP domain-containing protein [Pyrinomonadaceae bacterium]|nr:CAP domain-containing protein [Pyrinomonadaceae bacterium]
MSSSRFIIDRRSFLATATPFAFSLPALARAQGLLERGRFDDEQLPLAREQLLSQLNAERTSAGLNQLKLDDLACAVANQHARDMATGGFLSHWGSDGRKPYHRYSFAGGTAAIQENCSAAEDIESISPLRVLNDLHDMHKSMLDETPPHDGHRKTILFPFHTHVGFGIALNSRSLRLDELYLSRYVELDPIVTEARPGSTIVLSGRLLNTSHFLTEIAVFYEPLPKAPDIFWLRVPRSVSYPDDVVRLRPHAPDGTTYTDGSRGEFEWRNGRFRTHVKLYKTEPGIYTIVCMVRRVPTDKGFPGAEVCVVSK